jgi:hypothetical protein
LGQFTQPDSLIPQAYNPIALNRFAYVYNSPTNYTDSSGAFIDTLLDAADLAGNIQNCLGDSDALACYMTPVSAAAIAIPGATGTGAARHALTDEELIARIYTALRTTQAGEQIYQKASKLGLPEIEFRRMSVVGEYAGGVENTLLLNADLRYVSPEIAAPTLAHELYHRTRRWQTGSKLQEFAAHKIQTRVWEELRTRALSGIRSGSLDLDGFLLYAEYYGLNERTLRRVNENRLFQHILSIPSYRREPLSSINLLEDPINFNVYSDFYKSIGLDYIPQ